MGWEIVYFIVAVLISIALAPKPPDAKPAALDDFEFPVAEEGRPIPVIFGEVWIRGPNILWYGNLWSKAIRKRSGFSKTTIGYKYYMGFFAGLCHGPVDWVREIEVGEKMAKVFNITANGSDHIFRSEMFGGEKQEGGIDGSFDICMGGPAQTANSYLAANLAAPVQAFRGLLTFVWRGGYIGTSKYPKPWAFRTARYSKGWNNDELWYPEKVLIMQGTRFSMNFAHIIYEALTNRAWGRGMPVTRLDDTLFRAAADTLYDEGFGGRFMWNQAITIEQFIQMMLDHIAGVLVYDPPTAKFGLKLIRDDYDIEDLQVVDESNIISVDSYQRQAWGETINELHVKYRDPARGKDASITGHDLANIAIQGGTSTETLEFKGIQDDELAARILVRELSARSTPLAKIEFTMNRTGHSIHQGAVLNFNWSKLGISEMPIRVLKMNKGTIDNGVIRIIAVQDIFSLDSVTYLVVPPAETPPSDPPGTEDTPDDTDTNSVISTTETSPPASPNDGDRYYIQPGTGTGAWTGMSGFVEWDAEAEYDPETGTYTGAWIEIELTPGQIIYDEDTDTSVIVGDTGETNPFGGGSLTIIDVDKTPDEEITGVTDLAFVECEVQDLGGGLASVTPKVPLTTKGDLLSFSTTKVRVPVGVEGQYLRARSAEAAGIKWEGVAPVGEAASAARVYKDATQSIPNTTLTALTWPIEEFDTDAYHSTVTNTSRLTAVLAGKYIVGCSVKWDSNVTGTRAIYTVINGAVATRRAAVYQNAEDGLVQHVTDTLDLAASDYVEFYVYQDSGGARDVVNLERVTSAFITRVGVTAAPTLPRGATWVRAVAIATPVDDVDVRCPVKGQIVGVTIGTKGGAGSCVIDIWKDSHANYPPTVADSICGSSKPTISAGIKYEDTTLTGWTTQVNAGDWLTFHLESSSVFRAIFIQVYIKETQ